MKQILLQALILHFPWNKSRMECFAQIIISLIENCSVCTKDLAIGISGRAKLSSKVQRVYRFLREQIFDYDHVALFILSIFVGEKYTIALDRTCWKFGKTDINILFLVVVIGKISIPIYWYLLQHGGACDSNLMKTILLKFINKHGVDKIKYLLADREFMTKEWLKFLNEKKIKFAIPLKKDVKIWIKSKTKDSFKLQRMDEGFKFLKHAEYIEHWGILWGYNLKFAAHRNEKGELMVVASLVNIDVDIFKLYKFRWSIERLFKHLKSAGFDIEKSHITDRNRFAKLIAICAITSALIVKHGILQAAIMPMKMKRCNDSQVKEKQEFSLFTYGLDHLKHLIKQSAKQLLNFITKLILKPLDLYAISTPC